MGLFDTVHVHSPLLDPALHKIEFQTKDMDCRMDKYTITPEGQLLHTLTVWKGVPKKERPYWGKPEWKDKMFQTFGSIKIIPLRDVDTHYHGDLVFYGYCPIVPGNPTQGRVFREFKARFSDGQLQWIKELEPPPEDAVIMRPLPS